jgi:hypothetical protein
VANASFYANSLKVRKKGHFLILKAKMKCHHGKVIDEVVVTLPGKLAHFFTSIEDANGQTISNKEFNKTNSFVERFKRFSSDN